MLRTQNMKYLVKSLLPNWAMPYARGLREVAAAWHYWVPYVFRDGLAYPPQTVVLEVTYRCNLKCVMCPQAIDLMNPQSVLRAQMKEKRELTTDEIVNVIRQASQLDVKRFQITGGEAFLRRDIMQILSAVKEHGMACPIISNGGLMTEESAREIVRIGVDKITLSLDGPEDIHNQIRQNKHQFQDVMEAVRLIQAEKRRQKRNVPDLTLNVTVSALNAGRMSELVDIAAKEGVNVNYGYLYYISKDMDRRTRALYPPTGGKPEDQDVPMPIRSVNVDVLEQQIGRAETRAAQLGVKTTLSPNIRSKEELRRRFYDDDYAYVNTCFYPWNVMRINPYGDVYTCQMNITAGNVRDKKLEELWNGEAYVKFRRDLRQVGLWPLCTKCCALQTKLWDRLPKLRVVWDRNGASSH